MQVEIVLMTAVQELKRIELQHFSFTRKFRLEALLSSNTSFHYVLFCFLINILVTRTELNVLSLPEPNA